MHSVYTLLLHAINMFISVWETLIFLSACESGYFSRLAYIRALLLLMKHEMSTRYVCAIRVVHLVYLEIH